MVENYARIMGKHKYQSLQADTYVIVHNNTSLKASV